MMSEKREAIVIYLDLISDDTINDLTDDQLGAIFRAAIKHGKGEDVSASLDVLPRVVFRQIRDGIDRAWEVYKATCARNRINGKKGGRPRKRNPE
jgi:ABC-type phosphate transport system substrate-binding protein